MLNVFEQPWTLLTAAIIILLFTLIVRRFSGETQPLWQWLIPIFLAATAFGLDILVQTYREQINNTINTALRAAEEENPDAIEMILSDNYKDSYHNTKEDLMHYCRALLSKPLVEKNIRTDSIIEISPPKATVTLVVLTRFDKDSYVYKNFKRVQLTKIKLYLQKEQGKKWLINQAEILEIDIQPVDWNQIGQLRW